jgi:excisionase family DNA binding protein
MEDWHLSLSEVAGAMGVSERTVRRWIKSGKLRAYKPGRDYRIPESAVRSLIEESEISPRHISVRIGDDLSTEPARVEITYEGFLDVLRRHGLTRRAAEEAFEEFEELQRSA